MVSRQDKILMSPSWQLNEQRFCLLGSLWSNDFPADYSRNGIQENEEVWYIELHGAFTLPVRTSAQWYVFLGVSFSSTPSIGL